MAEQGAIPEVSKTRRRALRAVRALFTPLLPDDYLELINPLWSTRELRGRIERIEPETANSATVVIRPGYEWQGHRAGQYLRIGVVIDGVHHWRAYSLTSDPHRPDGCIAITPKLVEGGKVSPYLVRDARPGEVVRLGGVEGTFVLPDPAPEKILFISAGSGVTPIMSMVSSLAAAGPIGDVVHLHSARTAEDVIFGRRLRELEAGHVGLQLHLRFTGEHGRLVPPDLDEICPDWRQRHAFASGPGEMLDELTEHWRAEGDPELLSMERFQPHLGGEPGGGDGGAVRFAKSGVETACDGATPILVAGEEAGAVLPFGCRMGICHTCVGRLDSGQVRDLRTGEVHGSEGEMVRTCVNAPEGPIEIAL
ncbi:MAG: stearoyl-CoA 9-desaturase oxidoreductase [Solirubrobacterales bacterium]|jgi:ferredoxin-NADP reductase|nr:stearoyl-CoA 9-desaturase oxidoreductase [Solirubrobacterales bacterium]